MKTIRVLITMLLAILATAMFAQETPPAEAPAAGPPPAVEEATAEYKALTAELDALTRQFESARRDGRIRIDQDAWAEYSEMNGASRHMRDEVQSLLDQWKETGEKPAELDTKRNSLEGVLNRYRDVAARALPLMLREKTPEADPASGQT